MSSSTTGGRSVEINLSAAALAFSVASVVVALVTLIVMPKQEVIVTQNQNLLSAMTTQTQVLAAVGRRLTASLPVGA